MGEVGRGLSAGAESKAERGMGFHLLNMRLWLMMVLSMLQSPEEGDFRHSHYNESANFGAIVMLTTCSCMDQDRTLCSGRM